MIAYAKHLTSRAMVLIQEHLTEIAREWIERQETGTLPEGWLRKAAAAIEDNYDHEALAEAERLATYAAFAALAASQVLPARPAATTPSHDASAYWKGSREDGCIVLPAGATWTRAVYEHTTGPKVADVVCLPGETFDEAGQAWCREREAAWGHPVKVLCCTDDENEVEQVRIAALFGFKTPG